MARPLHRHEPGSPEARAIVAAHERLVSKGIPRGKAAARLLPEQSPESAARYLRKLRSGERTGRVLITREPIRQRVSIFAPRRLAELPQAGGPWWATVYVDTSAGPRAANAQLPRPSMTPFEFMNHEGYPRWVAAVESRWRQVNGYEVSIERVTKIRSRSYAGIRKVAVTLRTAA